MNRIKTVVPILAILLSAACSPHFHLDFLGRENIEEVVLRDSRSPDKVCVIDISGIISSSADSGLFAREGDLISRVYFRLLKAADDPRVKGIILRMDTPGGEVTASDIVYNEILKFRKRTGIPVVALAMGTAASGGYYIASACDYFMVHPSTITGSIGVISIFPNVRELLDKIGVEMKVIKSGTMKDAGSAFRDMTEEDREIFQGVIDEMYQKFLDVVHKSRKDKITRAQLEKLADGRIYTAGQALEAKLVDGIGYIDEALEKVKEMASIREAKVITYTYYPKSKTNIYAATSILKQSTLFDLSELKEILPSLKSGFYYLWLPSLGK
jgi:protease-4